MSYDLLVYGICFADLIYGQIPHVPRPGEEVLCGAFQFCGGGAYITAVAAARLGLKVAIVAPFGGGVLEQTVKQWLQAETVDTTWAYQSSESLPFVTVALNYGGDRGFLTYAPELDSGAFDKHARHVLPLIPARWIHIGVHQASAPLVDVARARQMHISMDVGWNESWLRDPALLDQVRHAQVFLPNRQEAQTITGTRTMAEAVNQLRPWTRQLIITDGPHGGLVKEEDGTVFRYAASAVPAVDSTGAGDNFTAGVIAALVNGMGLREAVQLGSFCGAASVQALGGTANSPTLETANRFLRSSGWQLRPWQERQADEH